MDSYDSDEECSPQRGIDAASEVSAASEDKALQRELMVDVAPVVSSSNKVSIIGTGNVGTATAFCLLTQNISAELALYDRTMSKAKGELMDLQQGSVFINNPKIEADSDFKVTENSHVILVTAGVRVKKGESRLQVLHRNLKILKNIVPQLVRYSPNAILIMVSNPVDILAYALWKMSGFPANRVFGTGTDLDTSRFHHFISQKINVMPRNIRGWIIGEHGNSNVPVWSGTTVAGGPIGLSDDEKKDIHESVILAAHNVKKHKEVTQWSVALCAANLVNTILRNERKIHAVSINCKGMYGIEEDVYLSLPCVVSENGINSIVKLPLTEHETAKFKESANILLKHMREAEL